MSRVPLLSVNCYESSAHLFLLSHRNLRISNTEQSLVISQPYSLRHVRTKHQAVFICFSPQWGEICPLADILQWTLFINGSCLKAMLLPIAVGTTYELTMLAFIKIKYNGFPWYQYALFIPLASNHIRQVIPANWRLIYTLVQYNLTGY